MKRLLGLIVVVAGALAMAAAPAKAGFIGITDQGASIVITGKQLEIPLISNQLQPLTVDFQGGLFTSFNGVIERLYNFVEPGNPNLITAQLDLDIRGNGVNALVTGIYKSISNPSQNFGTVPSTLPAGTFVLTKSPINPTLDLINIIPNLQIQVFSEIDVPGPGPGPDPVIPEPASITLFGIGLVGMASFAWRRRKTVAR